MKKVLCFVIVAVFCVLSPAWAMEFSADVVMKSNKKDMMAGKLFVANNKVRSEMAGMVNIVLSDKKIMYMLMPEQKMYMEHPIDAKVQASSASEKMPGEIERQSLGQEMIDGHNANKYRINYEVNNKRETVLQWLEASKSIPLKVSAEDGSWTVEYKNLKIGPQAASLFEIPDGYSKFAVPEMGNMMNNMKEMFMKK